MAMVNLENYEEYLVLYADGELSDAELKALEEFIAKHPGLKGEMEMYAATKLVPDEAITYAAKEQLLKKEPTTTHIISLRNLWAYGTAAACIAVLLVVMLNTKNRTEDIQIANNTNAHKESSTENKKIDTVVSETSHSTPVNIVAGETRKEDKQTIKKPFLQKQQYVAQQPSQKVVVQPLTGTEVEKIDLVHEEAIVTHQSPEVNATVNDSPLNELPEPTNKPVLHPGAKTDDSKLLAMVNDKKQKLQGLEVVGDALSEKIEKVKNIKNKIKETDLQVRIGEKNLFVLRF
jgi:hypothetical protein